MLDSKHIYVIVLYDDVAKKTKLIIRDDDREIKQAIDDIAPYEVIKQVAVYCFVSKSYHIMTVNEITEFLR